MALDLKRIQEHIIISLGGGKVGIEVDFVHINESIRCAIEILNVFLGWNEQYDAVVIPQDREQTQRKEFGSCDEGHFTAKLGGNETTSQSAICGTLQLPDNVLYVSEVYYTNQIWSGFGMEQFSFMGNVGLFRANVNPVQFYIWLQRINDLNKLYSVDPKWELLQGNVLRLDPNPGPGAMVIYKYTPRYDVDVNINNADEVKNKMGINIPSTELYFQLWIQRYALAHVKEILGRIRRRFSAYPSGEETVELDGEILLAESAVEKEKLMAELGDMSAPAKIFLL